MPPPKERGPLVPSAPAFPRMRRPLFIATPALRLLLPVKVKLALPIWRTPRSPRMLGIAMLPPQFNTKTDPVPPEIGPVVPENAMPVPLVPSCSVPVATVIGPEEELLPARITVPVPSLLIAVVPVMAGVKVRELGWLKFTVAAPEPPTIAPAESVPELSPFPMFSVPMEPALGARVTVPVPLPTTTLPLPVTVNVPAPPEPTYKACVLFQVPPLIDAVPLAPG